MEFEYMDLVHKQHTKQIVKKDRSICGERNLFEQEAKSKNKPSLLFIPSNDFGAMIETTEELSTLKKNCCQFYIKNWQSFIIKMVLCWFFYCSSWIIFLIFSVNRKVFNLKKHNLTL